jgi:hypothetical protein
MSSTGRERLHRMKSGCSSGTSASGPRRCAISYDVCDDNFMRITIREMDTKDRAAWAKVRITLWPDDTPQAHAEAIDELLKSDEN